MKMTVKELKERLGELYDKQRLEKLQKKVSVLERKQVKYSFSCPECKNKIKTSDKRCSKCKILLDWT